MKYTTTKVQFEKLEKKINRLFKKLDGTGATHTFQVLNNIVQTVPVYAIDELTQSKHKVDEMRVECVEFELEFDPYKVGDYRLGAVLERTVEDENLVYTLDEAIDFRDYATATLRCDHCGTNHNRKKAVVLINNETGEHKMVGKTCLKDYMGVQVDNFAAYLYALNEVLVNAKEPEIYDNEMHLYQRVADPVMYLAECVKITLDKGYFKDLKTEAWIQMKGIHHAEKKYVEIAEEVIKFFETYETTDNFEHNVRMYVTGRMPIVYENGFVAYAYTSYLKIQKRLEDEKNRLEVAAKSDYVGTVGQKINFQGTVNLVGGYETEYGYTRIYKFVDAQGNIYTWHTGSIVRVENGTEVNVCGTIKRHNEYRNEKQTVLTRCKVCEVA